MIIRKGKEVKMQQVNDEKEGIGRHVKLKDDEKAEQ